VVALSAWTTVSDTTCEEAGYRAEVKRALAVAETVIGGDRTNENAAAGSAAAFSIRS
jgi:hypothetical protein